MLSRCLIGAGSSSSLFCRRLASPCSSIAHGIKQSLSVPRVAWTPQYASRFSTLLGQCRHSITANSKQLTPKLLAAVRQSNTAASQSVASKVYPDISYKAQIAVGKWLAVTAGMVYGAVLIGGLTRLTGSGLSITSWDPIKGVLPPFSEAGWQKAFDTYKAFPEYRFAEKELTMEDFKSIYWMEWGHRNWGRLTGLMFLIPAIVFWKKGYIAKAMKPRIIGYGSLLALQAVLGMVMVNSGLAEDPNSFEVPSVSSYRLASHLGTALFLYTQLAWSAMMHLMPDAKDLTRFTRTTTLARLGTLAHVSMAMVFFTALAGSFMAALKGGLVYGTWPKFADRWIPSDLWAKDPAWKNFFENSTMTQFTHRHMGQFTGSLILLLWILSRRVPMPARTRTAINVFGGLAVFQVVLGITALVSNVPLWMAATHQSSSVALLTSAAWVVQEIKRIPK